MHIDCLILGLYETNCYVARADKNSNEVLVIDTGLDTLALAEFLKKNNLKPAAVIFTHGHVDHIVGAVSICDTWKDVKLYIHKNDEKMLTNPQMNLSLMSGSGFTIRKVDVVVEDGDIINEAGLQLKVIHTPGHTPGCICFYSKEHNVLFSGDTLFAGGVGRTDFPGGDAEILLKNIEEKLFTLPDETVVYPGHGPQTTIEQERRFNPFFR